jgi:hypothetical protein
MGLSPWSPNPFLNTTPSKLVRIPTRRPFELGGTRLDPVSESDDLDEENESDEPGGDWGGCGPSMREGSTLATASLGRDLFT